MEVADTIAKRSLCDGRQVGAVIVDDTNRPISLGYNGPPQGYPTGGLRCSEWCQRQKARQSTEVDLSYGLKCPTVHAEANALMFADRRDYKGGTIYVTAACCGDCAKLIANSGIKHIVMRLDDRDAHRDPYDIVDFVRQCGLDVRTI